MPNESTTTTTTRPVEARDLRTGDRIELMPDHVVTVVADARLITTGWRAGRDLYSIAGYVDGADGPHSSTVKGDAIYRVIVEEEPEPSPLATVWVEIDGLLWDGTPVPSADLERVLEDLRIGFLADGFAHAGVSDVYPSGNVSGWVTAGGRADSVRLDRLQRRIREAVIRLGAPRVRLAVNGKLRPVYVSTLK